MRRAVSTLAVSISVLPKSSLLVLPFVRCSEGSIDIHMTRLIAEIGANHMGDLNIARAMVDAAAAAGCDTVKFQSWRPEKLVKSFPDYHATFTRHSKTVLT